MYLNTHSWFSMRYGTLSIPQLLKQAAQRNIKALALTDINIGTGVWQFLLLAPQYGITPLIGLEFRSPQNELLYIGIAHNLQGIQFIFEYFSEHQLEQKPLPKRAPQFFGVSWIYIWNKSAYPEKMRFDEWVGLPPTQFRKWMLDRKLGSIAHKLLFTHSLTFSGAIGRELHKHLRAVDFNTLITNVNAAHLACETETWLSAEWEKEMKRRFPEIAIRTERFMNSCTYAFDFKQHKNLRMFSSSYDDDARLLRSLAQQGLDKRYTEAESYAKARLRMENELNIIEKMGFNAYYLMTWDIVRYGKSKGFYHIGRGSGANSLVAYALGITDVDPLELNLYFERFLNPKRESPPDFDIDYSWDERDDIYRYIFQKYNKPNERRVALLGTISTFGERSVIREMGKAYGLPKEEIDRIEDNPSSPLNSNSIMARLLQLLSRLNPVDAKGHRQHFPNQLGIHAGGVLISQVPVTQYTPLYLPPKGFPTAQIDMYGAEEIALDKLDILSQRGIGHIKSAVEIIRYNRGVEVDVHQFNDFKKDEVINLSLKQADTMGCFYIESPAMRQLLSKLHCDNYLTLVAASSIIRPGVAQSGMMRQFILRHHHPQSFEYLHPIMEEHLGETYGVMVYQEDVIKVCHHYAGMDLGEADILRRAMSGKYRSSEAFQNIKNLFFEGAKRLGRPEDTTEEIWRQVSSFGGYSFCKAHSASFAVESYQSLFLKTYFPLEFYVAVINNFGGFYQTWVYVHMAKMNGATIHQPCVNKSEELTNIYNADVYLGFIHIKGLNKETMERIVQERENAGPYLSLDNFLERTQCEPEQLKLLIKAGAMRFTNQSKNELMLRGTFCCALAEKEAHKPQTPLLFYAPPVTLPALQFGHNEQQALEDAYDELHLLGFPVTLSDFEMLSTELLHPILNKDLPHYLGKEVEITGKLVTYKTIRTKNGKAMIFGTFIDKTGAFFDSIHFPDTIERFPFVGGGVYNIKGKVVEEFAYYSLEVRGMQRLAYRTDPRWR